MGGPAPMNPQGPIGAGINQITPAQEQANIEQAQAQSGFSREGQAATLGGGSYDAFGSIAPKQTGTGPNGVPIYSMETTLSPAQQAILNQQTQALQQGGQAANRLLAGANYGSQSPSQAIGSMTSGLTGQNLGMEASALAPYFNLNSMQTRDQLAAQGITPGTDPTAYNAGMLPVQTAQNSTLANFLASQEPTVWGQQAQAYQMPELMALQMTPSPTMPTNIQLPQYQTPTVGSSNVAAGVNAATTPYVTSAQQQQAQYNAMLQGLFGIPSSVLGGLGTGIGKGWASSLFGGGSSGQ